MLRKDIEVEIPESKIRFRKQNGNKYVYAVLGRAGDSKGNEKDVTLEIGKFSREGFMHPNDSFFRLFPEKDIYAVPTMPSAFDTQSRIGAVAALCSIAKKKGVLDCLKLAFGEENASLILSLASYYTVARDSAAMLYSDFMFDHYGVVTEIASESTISRLFNREMDVGRVDAFRSAYLKHCFTEALKKKNGKKEKTRLFVDLDSTNINVSSSGCTDAEYGKAKVDEGLPQINMAYFYDRSSGVPVFYDSFYGSITDITHCTTGIRAMMDNLNRNPKNVCYDFVLDRGYFSQQNMDSLSEGNISFAVMGKYTSVFSEYIRDRHDEIRSSVSLISLGVYGMRLRGKAFAKQGSPDYNIYLYFDSTKETEEKSGIEQKLMDAKKALDGKKNDRTGGLRRTYGNYLRIETTKGEEAKIKSVEVNRESVDAMLSEAGYFWIVSTMELEPAEMLRAYRERDEIEKSFRIVKCESDLNKSYAQNNVALNAKLLMGFVTAILRGEFTAMTRKIAESKTNLSTQKMLLALDKIIMYQVNGHYAMKYAYTALQQEILKAINVDKSEIENVITLWNSKDKADGSIKS